MKNCKTFDLLFTVRFLYQKDRPLRLLVAGILSLTVLGMPETSRSAPNNVALNAPVAIIYGGTNVSNPSTPDSVVTDGTFVPEESRYGDASGQAVEWSGATSGGAPATGLVLEIDLGGNFTITGAIVQGDDNDNYLLEYYDETNGTWQTLWSVPAVSVGFGLRTRPNADQTTYQPVGPVVTDAVRVSAVSGDGGYAISEVELQGTPVSGGATPALGIGTLGNQKAVYWPVSTTNVVLQTTTNLASPNWVTVTNGVPVTGVLVPNTSPAAFFRLQTQ